MSLSVQGVSQAYNGQKALHDIDLALNGGLVALLGANGSGKTTLLRLLATLDMPQSGVIRWQGVDYGADLARMRRMTGYLPQTLELPDSFTPMRLLRYLAQLRHVPFSVIDEVFSKLALNSIANERLSDLSGGQRRLIGIAQSMIGNPDLLLLDELTLGLDVAERERVYHLLVIRTGLTIFSTHIPDEAEQIAATVIVLHQGRVLFCGTPDAMREQAMGACYELTVPHSDSDFVMRQANISRLVQQNGHITARIIDSQPPAGDAQLVAPSLEDAYLYLVATARQVDLSR